MTVSLVYFGPLVSVNHKYTITKGRKLVINPNFRKMLQNFSSQFLPQLWAQHEILRQYENNLASLTLEVTIELFRLDKKRYKDIDVDNVVKPTIDTITRLLGIDDEVVVALHSIRGGRIYVNEYFSPSNPPVIHLLNQRASGWVLNHILRKNDASRNSRRKKRRNGGKKRQDNHRLVTEWVPIFNNLRRTSTQPTSLHAFIQEFYLETFLSTLQSKSRLYMMSISINFRKDSYFPTPKSPKEAIEVLRIFE